jgi:hypothetical protein
MPELMSMPTTVAAEFCTYICASRPCAVPASRMRRLPARSSASFCSVPKP